VNQRAQAPDPSVIFPLHLAFFFSGFYGVIGDRTTGAGRMRRQPQLRTKNSANLENGSFLRSLRSPKAVLTRT
jgi:hypothetical protein